MVRVAPSVRLHYLDFGGPAGAPTILFLAGLGNTAHSFDDFAPLLTDKFHVVALTRRGFGESDHPDSGYDTRRLVADIRAAITALHLGRVTVIGHSIAGEEITRLAGQYPSLVDKLVYLDGAYDRVAADAQLQEIFPVPPNLPGRPEPTAADTATPAAYVAFVHRVRGVNIPEADIRVRFKYDGWREEIGDAYQSIQAEHPNYARGQGSGTRDLRRHRFSLPARAVAAHRPRARGGVARRDPRTRSRRPQFARSVPPRGRTWHRSRDPRRASLGVREQSGRGP